MRFLDHQQDHHCRHHHHCCHHQCRLCRHHHRITHNAKRWGCIIGLLGLFEKECISVVVFLGKSGHSELVGLPFKNHFLKKFFSTQSFFLEKVHFPDSVSRQTRSFRVDWTPFSKTIFWKYNPWGLFWAPPRGPLGTRILVNFFLYCQALPSGPETAAKPSLLICSRSILYNDSTNQQVANCHQDVWWSFVYS